MKKLAACLLLVAVHATAVTLTGHVVGVADGDTVTVLKDDHSQVKIRLAEIDAPEKAQPFGMRSKQSLSDLCFDKDALIEAKEKDRYGRTVGRLFCNGVDANAEQVKRGMAWVYVQYAKDQSLYKSLEEAQTAKLGLWYDANPTPPWVWRRSRN